ncbi:hypothetical protein V502_02011 [Pseudogymnoascus sp. VKM F-4520 (FW-2644)]|nr:hypothetical protein V502_02011 [Pseudogymnoascus sp. VKM F-4520 (FW-2644)]
MEQLSHLPEFQVVICKKCKYAVLPSFIDSHFALERPHGFMQEARQQITDGLGRIGGLIKNEEILKRCKFPFPADTSSPIAALAAPQSNGFRCPLETSENTVGASMDGRASIRRFFVQGPKSGFFEVGRDRTERQPNPAPVTEAERRKIAAIDESMEPSPWLRFTGWPDHLGTFDPVKLQAFVWPVQKEEEAELHIIHKAFMSMIQEAQSIAVKSCEDLEEDEQPRFKFTSWQRVSLDGLMEAADQLSDYQEEGKSDNDEVCKEAQVNVQQALLRFCIALLDHNLVNNKYQSAIISGLAVLGVREDKGWDNPEDYTPKLSAVIKLSQLMVIQMAYQTQQDTIAERVGQGWSQEQAEEECPGHVELVQGMC